MDRLTQQAERLMASITKGAEQLDQRSSNHPAIATTTEEGTPRPQAAVLTDIGKTHHLFHDEGGDPFAKVGGGAYLVTGVEYRELLAREYYRLTGKGANRNAIADAVNTLSAIAKFDGPQEPVFLRVGEHDECIVIDGGGSDWGGYIVRPGNWERVDRLPVHFRRAGKPLPLPKPTAADFSRLWRHVNAAPEHRALVAGFLLSALRPRGPFPALALVAEQGSGKSHASRTLKALTDPSASPLRAPPKDERDLLVAATNSWVLALDNLSGIDHQLSDALCRLATGGALAGRRLYSDTDEILIELQRPVILNGIDDIATRPDLAERCLHIALPPIRERVTEADLQEAWREDAGAIFAALLDGLALALERVELMELGSLPRMADFARFAAAGMPALGFSEHEFIEAYRQNQAEAIETGLESSPVGDAIRTFMENRTEWTGTSGDLLQRLLDVGGDTTAKSWPRSQKGLINALRRLAPSLRHLGITWEQDRSSSARLIRLCKVAKQVSQASQVSRPDDAMTLMTHENAPCTADRCPRCDGDGCAWCEGNGHQPVSNTRFGLALGERGFQREKLGTIRWLGVGLLDSGRLDSLDRSSSSTDSRAHNPGNAELGSRPSSRPDWEVF